MPEGAVLPTPQPMPSSSSSLTHYPPYEMLDSSSRPDTPEAITVVRAKKKGTQKQKRTTSTPAI